MEQVSFKVQKSKIISGLTLMVFMFTVPILIRVCGIKLSLSTPRDIVFNELYVWLILGLIFSYVTKVEKQKFLLLGEKSYPLKYTLKSGFKLMMTLILISVVILLILKPLGLNNKSDRIIQLNAIIHGNRLLILFMALTAGVTEELLIRGYLFSRLEILLKKPAAIIISAVFFAALHIAYGTVAQVLFPLGMGLLFTIHYYKYRDIKLLIFCHFLWDLNSFLLKAPG